MAETKKKVGRPPGSKNKKKEDSVKTKAKEEIEVMQEKRKADQKVIDEIWAFILIALGAFIFAAVQFHAAGEFGNTIGDGLKGIFGLIGLLVPWYLILFGILLFAQKTTHISLRTAALAIVILLMLCLLNSERYIDANNLVYKFSQFYEQGVILKGGGFFGMSLGTLLVKIIGSVGLYIFASVIAIICLMLVINTPISRGIENLATKREARKILKEKTIEEKSEAEEKYTKTVERVFPEEMPRQKPKIITPFDDEGHLGIGKAKPQGKSNIIDYMTKDDPFDEGAKKYSSSYGLEKSPESKKGYGLSESGIKVNEYGLDGNSHPDQHGEIRNFETPVPSDEVGVISKDETPKLSKKEAGALTLNPDEISGTKQTGRYKKPSIELLNRPPAVDKSGISGNLQKKAEKLEQTLQNFNVDARVVQVTQGPAITRYEIQPNIGVKVNSIVRLADDIALNLEAKSIRIEAPIPGKAAVGIEVENDKINMVTLREIIDSREFKNAKSKITFAVGKDIAGKAIVADLKTMPHLLIAGSTGSGKSVCINSIITSILYKANPDEVKLVLIDPKVVELGNYNGIPHLLIPVVTEPTKAAAALNWAVAEMTDRYKKFAETGVRDLESYNEYMKINNEKENVMPQIVVIIDELADLMMAAPSQVEESICRLAQMARAAGMHLIVATQRPSVDIITGVIKANIPSRIAFAVSSQFDSRTILDMGGAEKLVGKGDMLFNPLGMGKPIRVQGTFISDKEVNDVIEYVKSQVEDVEYSGEVINTIEKSNVNTSSNDDEDELLPDAIQCVVSAGQASVSMLQRRFRIGYNRAARIIDILESRGIVGPQDGSRPRQVLLSEDEYTKMENEIEE